MDIARKWLPPISAEHKLTIINAITGTRTTYGTPLLRKYIELLRPYKDILGLSDTYVGIREIDCLASGLIFFYGCMCYIMHFPNWGKHIEDIFLYNLLYILVDHYIDDMKLEDSVKSLAISQMFLLIEDPLLHKTLDLADPILGTISDVYHKLLVRCPRIKPAILRLFQAQICGVKIQKSSDHTRETYYDVAMNKGGYTMQVCQYIVDDVDESISDASYHIGTIMQLIDDTADVFADIDNGINTLATYEIQHGNKLDGLWYDIMNRIDKIDDRFIIFKFLYTMFAIYLPDRHRDYFSEELWKETTNYNLFDYNCGCDGTMLLVHAVMNELIAIETLEMLKEKSCN